MKDALQIVAGLVTPLIAIVAVYIAVQQHNAQRDKLRLDLYEKRLTVFNATMNLLASVDSHAVADGGAIYRFITDTANARFLFGVEMEKYLDSVGTAVRQQRKLHARVVSEQKEGKTDTVKEEYEALDRLLAETERVKERFQPYLGFPVRASTESQSIEQIFFRLMILAAVVSFLALGAATLATRERAKQAREAGRTFREIVVERERVCDSTPQSTLCDATSIGEYRKGMRESYEAGGELSSQADRLFMLALAVPLGCILAFYAGRWVVTAKVRPFRPA